MKIKRLAHELASSFACADSTMKVLRTPSLNEELGIYKKLDMKRSTGFTLVSVVHRLKTVVDQAEPLIKQYQDHIESRHFNCSLSYLKDSEKELELNRFLSESGFKFFETPTRNEELNLYSTLDLSKRSGGQLLAIIDRLEKIRSGSQKSGNLTMLAVAEYLTHHYKDHIIGRYEKNCLTTTFGASAGVSKAERKKLLGELMVEKGFSSHLN